MELPVVIVAANLPVGGRSKPVSVMRSKREQPAGVMMAFTTPEQIRLSMASKYQALERFQIRPLRVSVSHLVRTKVREELGDGEQVGMRRDLDNFPLDDPLK
jgi:hypothetical protein